MVCHQRWNVRQCHDDGQWRVRRQCTVGKAQNREHSLAGHHMLQVKSMMRAGEADSLRSVGDE